MKIIILTIILLLFFPMIGTNTIIEKDKTCAELEGFAIYDGKIYVIKSEIIPGKFYWDTTTWKHEHKRVWIEIYIANGRYIILYKIIEVKITPSQPEKWDVDKNLLEVQ